MPRSGRRARRKRTTVSSDDDFEIDNSSDDLDSSDNVFVSDSSASEESDLEDEDITFAPSVSSPPIRTRRSAQRAAAAGSRKRNKSSDGGESSVQFTDLADEEEKVQRKSRRRSMYGVSRMNARISSITDERSDKRKGKRKAVEVDVKEANSKVQITEDTSAAVCGICLSEEDVERGKLDCCDHFFCFGCIMEWAKVESRCPMCKQRFVTIARPNTGGSKRVRAVRIPLRDQVYEPPDDEVPVDDPFSDTVCMECHETGEEGLLLLCDRCDSAAHTYCVGLGRSVPRGDWFCRSCQDLIAEESSDSDFEEEVVLVSSDDDEEAVLREIVASTGTTHTRTTRQEQAQNVSTSAIRPVASSRRTRRARSGTRRRLWRRLSRSGHRRNRSAAVPRLSRAARELLRNTESADAGRQSHNVETQASLARTVPQQRRLQERIQTMRNNWGRIQEGVLQFTAIGVHPTASVQETTLVNDGNDVIQSTCSPTDLNSTEEKHSTAQVNVSSLVGPTSAKQSSSCDDSALKQAWRMMEQAKSISADSSLLNTPRASVGAAHHPRAVSMQATGGTRQTAASTVKTIAGSNGRASNFFMAHGPETKKTKISAASNKTDSTVNACLGIPKDVCDFDLEARLVHNRGKPVEEGGSRQPSNRCDSSNSGPVVHAGSDESGKCRQQHSLNGAIHNSASNRKEIASQEQVHCNLISLEKQGHTKQETGMVNVSDVKEHGNVAQPDCSAHLLSHASVETAGLTTHDKLLSAAGDRDSGCSLNNFYDEKEHLVGACAAVSASSHVREKCKPESLKDHLAKKVKAELWPTYLSGGLGKGQFKEIARSSVHTLLDLCGPQNRKYYSRQLGSLSCSHNEQHTSSIAGCCENCLTLEVERVVGIVKEKLQAS